MKHKPFAHLLKDLKNATTTEEVNMVIKNATTKRPKPTKAEVKIRVKNAKAMLKANPSMTMGAAAKEVGIAPMTLSKYLKTKTRKPKTTKAKTETLDDSDVFIRYQKAKEEFNDAREALIQHVQENGV